MNVAYDGNKYQGWQKNKNAKATIQTKLEETLSRMLDEEITIQGSGRTDKGAHAKGQIANFHATKFLDTESFEKELNAYLPESLAVSKLQTCDERFHSRLSAKGKHYSYTIRKRYAVGKDVFRNKFVYEMDEKMNLSRLSEGIDAFVGTHDFKGFSRDKTKKSTVRNIEKIEIEENEEYLVFHFYGNGFLYQMIRIIMGTLIEIGLGKREVSTIETIYEKKVREDAGFLVPAEGLCLEEVFY